MSPDEFHTLLAYNRWANRRLLAAAARLTPAELNRDLSASFLSVRGTLRHILWGELRWLRFWQRGELIPELAASELQDLTSIEESWTSMELEQQLFVAELTDERLGESRSIGTHQYSLGELIQHLLNHSTYHRGQIALLLRQLGHTPPPTEYRLFLTEVRDGVSY